jgi:crossover junction endodeoxyribonuclease RusA
MGPLSPSPYIPANIYNNNNNIYIQRESVVAIRRGTGETHDPKTQRVGAIHFYVAGMPATQGSKRGFVQQGRVRLVETGGNRLVAWRHAVAAEARLRQVGQEMLLGPVDVEAGFLLPRPASAPKRKRTWPVGARSGDLDKLARAILDACTGVLYADDAQVVDLHVTKDWAPPGSQPGMAITVRAHAENAGEAHTGDPPAITAV